LKDAHVAGRSARFTRDDALRTARAVVHGDDSSLLGVPTFTNLTMSHVNAAIEMVYGWDGEGTRARIDPTNTLDGFDIARDRIVEVARAGGTLAFATSRPASLSGVYRALVATAVRAGGAVLDAPQSSLVDGDGRRLWWSDGVAAVTDGRNLLAYDGIAAADELLFVLPRPDLVVADGWFAGAALATGLEVVASVDLDAVALAVAAWRGMAIRVVPLDQGQPPQAYLPLLEALDEVENLDERHDRRTGLAGRSSVVRPRSGS
jgi:hypothetical protein